ncbi:hypothetical protein [Peribacillus sp. AS_2]|uniref:hypothetical protein n=1 Tax=Peribacillus sp. AS_2 TaxID=2996755 RepID=UPI0022A69C1E|nr:hypothetical protein [Peribacillus sp. AS_2]MCZ0875629.1 hypothetical protein [Peribacillus sp. AS_2]
MKVSIELFFFTIIPGVLAAIGYFMPLSVHFKVIISLSLATLYFIIFAIFLQRKLNKTQSTIATLQDGLEESSDAMNDKTSKLDAYVDFVHKRKLFIKHDLKELSDLIVEYEGHVKNHYRGQKYQEVRDEVGSVKKRAVEIINKEKRDFDEQLYHVQSDKDNR